MKKILKNLIRLLDPKRIAYRSRYVPNRVIYEINDQSEDKVQCIQFKPKGSNAQKNDSANLFILRRGRIDTDNDKTVAVINSNNELLAEPSFNYGTNGFVTPEENLVFSTNYYSQEPLKLNGSVFSFLSGGGSSKNYYHWLYDSLTRLHVLRSGGIDLNEIDHFLVPGPLQTYKQMAIKILGLPREKIINSQEQRHIIAEKLIVTSHPNNPTSPMPLWIPIFLQELFNELRKVSEKKSRLFVSRSRAATRRLINENEIYSVLAEMNFKKVFLEELSFDEQVSLFTNAETIISPHGAGLANLVFCSPRTVVIELFPNASESSIYSDIADLVGLNYSKINEFHEASDVQVSDLHIDFRIDLKLILNRLHNHSSQIG